MFGFLLSNTSQSEEHTIANEWKKQNELEFFVLKLKLRDTVELDNIQDRLMCWVLGFLVFVFVFVLVFFFQYTSLLQLHCSCLEGTARAVKSLTNIQLCMAADE